MATPYHASLTRDRRAGPRHGRGPHFALRTGASGTLHPAAPRVADDHIPGLQTLSWRVVESLASYPSELLEQVTREASIFFDAAWFRMLETLDLSQLVGGPVRLRYVVVETADDVRPLAVCPLLVCRDPGIYFFYSLDKYFFLHWAVEAARLEPEKAGFFQKLARFTNAYRAVAKCCGANMNGWVLAVSPLSHRGDVAVDPRVLGADNRARVLQTAIDGLKHVAARERLPLCFFGVEERRDELRRALRTADFRELFLVYDHALPLAKLATVEDYLGKFRSSGRRLFRREIQAAGRAGFHFERISDPGRLASDLARLYASTYDRYGEEHFLHPAAFWSALGEHLGPRAEALVAYRGRQVAGFSLLLAKNDLWFYRVGRRYDQHTEQGRVYFNLAFYEPIRRALEANGRGGERLNYLWLGAGATEAKHRRGGTGHALYSYLWFPRRWDGWLLMPYLDNFAKISRLTQATASRNTSYLRSATPTTTPA
jgi:predicted N-acyltransferase